VRPAGCCAAAAGQLLATRKPQPPVWEQLRPRSPRAPALTARPGCLQSSATLAVFSTSAAGGAPGASRPLSGARASADSLAGVSPCTGRVSTARLPRRTGCRATTATPGVIWSASRRTRRCVLLHSPQSPVSVASHGTCSLAVAQAALLNAAYACPACRAKPRAALSARPSPAPPVGQSTAVEKRVGARVAFSRPFLRRDTEKARQPRGLAARIRAPALTQLAAPLASPARRLRRLSRPRLRRCPARRCRPSAAARRPAGRRHRRAPRPPPLRRRRGLPRLPRRRPRARPPPPAAR